MEEEQIIKATQELEQWAKDRHITQATVAALTFSRQLAKSTMSLTRIKHSPVIMKSYSPQQYIGFTVRSIPKYHREHQ